MGDHEVQREEHAAEVTARNVAGMRELLARKHEQEEERAAEAPLTDDPNIPAQENPLVQESTGTRGSTGGIRNLGGGRS